MIDNTEEFAPGPPANTVYVTIEEYLRDFHGKLTTWRNPLPYPQRVDIELGMAQIGSRRDFRGFQRPVMVRRVLRVEIPPADARQIPSMYDHAIHTVVCSDAECQGKLCRKGHAGVIIGGIAPLLVREGQAARVDEALIPALPKAVRSTSVAPQDILAVMQSKARKEEEEQPKDFASRARGKR